MTNKLSIQVLMHVPYEGLGCIEQWITANGHSVSFTRFYKEYRLPSAEDFDWLIIMGGPMGVHDEAIYPWLSEEKKFIKRAIDHQKTVIGICLGSQLIAEVLGAKVYPNKQKEIGWFDVQLTETAKNSTLFQHLEEHFTAFHWHGDTYDLPSESQHLFRSDICDHQAFLYNEKVLGVQFHFEVTPLSLQAMIENGENELVESKTVQSVKQILKQTSFFESNNKKLYRILDFLAR